MKNDAGIVCFGEILWDVFPNEKKPGGAAFNVAAHLSKLGLKPKFVSRVGEDEHGTELIGFANSISLDTSFIQTDAEQPTGMVQVNVGKSGDATYDIVFPSAWDFIEYPDHLEEEDFCLVFGSLASRNAASRSTLTKLLEKAGTTFFDVNFRAPHYTRELIEELLLKSDFVKLNEDEIEILGEWLGIDVHNHEQICDALISRFRIEQIILTLGGDGAAVYQKGKIHRHPGFRVKVCDTVGSGDSFLASYLANSIKGVPVEECLQYACATGAFVATQNGAFPEYTVSDIENMIHTQH